MGRIFDIINVFNAALPDCHAAQDNSVAAVKEIILTLMDECETYSGFPKEQAEQVCTDLLRFIKTNSRLDKNETDILMQLVQIVLEEHVPELRHRPYVTGADDGGRYCAPWHTESD